MNSPVAQRSSIPLTEADLRALDRVRLSPTHRAALHRLTGEPSVLEDLTRAALLHAVLTAGLAAVNEAAEEVGYAMLAEQRRDASHRAEARRRLPSWAAEA